MAEEKPTRVECQECQFSEVVEPGDDRVPADIVIEHGKKRGHKLSVKPLVE